MELKSGLVLKDNQFNFGYAILANKKEDKYHFVTFYNLYENFFTDELLGWDVSLEEIKDSLIFKKLELLDNKNFKKIEELLNKKSFIMYRGLERIGLPENYTLHNKV